MRSRRAPTVRAVTTTAPGAPAAPRVTVAPWPRVSATFHADATATVLVNDREHPADAPSTARLASGVLARSVAVARTVARPVRLHLTDAAGTRPFAVFPDGTVARLLDDGTVDPAPVPPAQPSPCRRCGAPQDVAAPTCSGCGALEPHRVERTPVPVLDAATLTHPDAVLVDDLRAALSERTPAGHGPAARRTLRLTFADQAPITVQGSVSLGRNPAAVRDRTPVRVVSASMTVSKTHAFVDVDDRGTITVTDSRSANGTVVLVDPPVLLTPGQPYRLEPGTSLRLGDVTCTVGLDA